MANRMITNDAVAELTAANFYVEVDDKYLYIRKASNSLPDRLMILNGRVSSQRVEEFLRRGNI